MRKCSITIVCTVVLDTDQDQLQSNGSYEMVDYVAIVHGYTAMRTLCHEHLLSSFGYFRSDTTDLPLQSPVRAGQWRQCALQGVAFRHRTYMYSTSTVGLALTGDQHTAPTAPPRLETIIYMGILQCIATVSHEHLLSSFNLVTSGLTLLTCHCSL